MKTNNFFYDWKVKIICFLLASLTFFVIANSNQAERRILLPIDVILPDGYVAESNIPSGVDLVIQGTEERIYMVDITKIKLSADFSGVSSDGVTSVPVVIDVDGDQNILDMSTVTLYTDPSVVKIYFTKR